MSASRSAQLARLTAAHSATGQMLRYLAVGGLVAVTYIGGTFLLEGPGGLPLAAAIAIAYTVAVLLHFALQRAVVFRHHRDEAGFALPVRAQILRYVVLGVAQYAITVAATKLLPGPLGVDERVVYVITVAIMSAVGFTVLRTRTFHAAA